MSAAWILREEGLKNIYAEVDGFYVWTPAPGSGSLTEHSLRTMADYLQAKNAAWQWVIDNDPTIGAPQSDRAGVE